MGARKSRRLKRLPMFTEQGVLPPGDYELTLEELGKSFLVLGPADPADCPNWDSAWRFQLVENAAILIHQLWQIGINEIFLDGSFVEEKDHPNDIDGYFACERDHLKSGRLQQELNLIDPYKVWSWDPKSRRKVPGTHKPQLPMWHQYRVELYPHYGQSSGILDQYGNNLEFPAAFRLSRQWIPKGIIKIVRDV
ncbi:MAG: DUF6932 family protein [Planctomycetaceae bacterium]